jgi:hypothetical protein
MLDTIIVLLVVMWLLGVLTNYTLGGLLHLLLVLAIVSFVVRIVTGRKPVA